MMRRQRRDLLGTNDSGSAGDLDDENFQYNLNWAKNRAFLKQLVKDNIDISLFENEIIRQSQIPRPKTWRSRFLGILRSQVLQIFLSFLVLLDAGIVISEIVLEIQSLQTYKNNFHNQLDEARLILCNLLQLRLIDFPNTPPIFFSDSLHSSPVSYNPAKPLFEQLDLNKHSSPPEHLIENASKLFSLYSACSNSDELQYSSRKHSNNELLYSMYDVLRAWREFDFRNIECISKNQTSESRGQNSTLLRSKNEENTVIVKKFPAEVDLQQSMTQLTSNRAMTKTVPDSLMDNRRFTRPPRSVSTSNMSTDTEHSLIGLRPTGAQAMHEASEILHYLSIAITGLFLICVLLKLACLGRRFFKETNQFLDAAIVIASFASDILYVRYVSETAAAMVVLLLWRIFRIINALMMHKQQQYELRISIQKRARRVMGRKLEISRTEKEMQGKHISALEDLLRETGTSEEAIKKCKPRYKECTKEQTNNALKSIAALTTGVMGGLVGAPSNIQGVISKYGGSTTLNTPTTSQKNLYQMFALSTSSSGVTTVKETNSLKAKQSSTEYGRTEKYTSPLMAKSTSATFDRESHTSSPGPDQSRRMPPRSPLRAVQMSSEQRGSSLDESVPLRTQATSKEINRYIDDCESEDDLEMQVLPHSDDTPIDKTGFSESKEPPTTIEHVNIKDLLYRRKLFHWDRLKSPFCRMTGYNHPFVQRQNNLRKIKRPYSENLAQSIYSCKPDLSKDGESINTIPNEIIDRRHMKLRQQYSLQECRNNTIESDSTQHNTATMNQCDPAYNVYSSHKRKSGFLSVAKRLKLAKRPTGLTKTTCQIRNISKMVQYRCIPLRTTWNNNNYPILRNQ